jgi:hypothetical protein
MFTSLYLTELANEAGRYMFAQVPPGTYTVTFTKQGFTGSALASSSFDIKAGLHSPSSAFNTKILNDLKHKPKGETSSKKMPGGVYKVSS